jgi:hypothetical protein
MKAVGRSWILTFVVVVALGLQVASGAQTQRSDEVALKAAQHKEEVEGDVRGALEQYKRLSSSQNRAVAAQALLRLAGIYRTQGDAQARAIYQQLVRDFGDQPEVAAQARAQLLSAAASTGMSQRVVWHPVDGADLYGRVSPDGRYIPYTNWDANGNLFIYDRQAGENRQLTFAKATNGDEFAENVVFSPDARSAAYAWFVKDRFQVRLIRLDDKPGSTPRVLVDDADFEWIWPADWSRDGKLIALGILRQDRTSQIALLSTDTDSLRILKSVPWRGYMNMAFSPDSRHLAVDMKGDHTNASDVFVLAIDGSRDPVRTPSTHQARSRRTGCLSRLDRDGNTVYRLDEPDQQRDPHG